MTLPQEFWIIVTEWDCDPSRDAAKYDIVPMGPLVHETYCLSEEKANERAAQLNRYGWVRVIKVRAYDDFQI